MGERAFLSTPKGASRTARLADRFGGRPSGQGSFGGPNLKQASKQDRESMLRYDLIGILPFKVLY